MRLITIGLSAAVTAALLGGGGFYLHSKRMKSIEQDIAGYIKDVYKIERKYITKVPIYQDIINGPKERKMRRHLWSDHIKISRAHGIPVVGKKNIKALVKKGKLVSIDSKKDRLYFFYNVKKAYRYLTPDTAAGLQLVGRRFQKNLQKRTEVPPVKIAVSSALRPIQYQQGLTSRNMNAVNLSTHSFGTSFDIFFDDYFVVLPPIKGDTDTSKKAGLKLQRKFGFLLGDSLRRQFKAVLAETLMELQDEGKLYVILERRQRCFHITPLPRKAITGD